MRLSLRFTKRLKAPRREVFRLVTGYERLHERFPNLFSSVRVLDKSKDRATTEETFFLLGATVTQRSRHEVRAPTLHRVEVMTGDLAGSTIVERYAEGPEGETTVEVEAQLVLSGLVSLLPPFVVKPLVESNAGRIFDEVESYLERGSRV